MFALVICVDTSLDDTPLTYLIPDHLAHMQPGWIVSVPFRDELMTGIVVSIEENADIFGTWIGTWNRIIEEIKPIVGIEVARSVLDVYQIRAILFLAKHFFLHIHKALGIFLPAPYLRQAIKKWALEWEKKESSSQEYTSSKMELTTISASTNENYTILIKQAFQKGIRSVFSFPFEKTALAFFDALPEEIKAKTLYFPDSLAEVRDFRQREMMLSGEYLFVVWNRRILLYNAREYDTFVYIEDSLNKTLIRSFHTIPYESILTSFAASGKKVQIVSSFPQLSDWVFIKRNQWIVSSLQS